MKENDIIKIQHDKYWSIWEIQKTYDSLAAVKLDSKPKGEVYWTRSFDIKNMLNEYEIIGTRDTLPEYFI